MTIEYITDVRQDGKTTFVISINGKSVNVEYTPEIKRSYNDYVTQEFYKYGKVNVNGDMTIHASSAHLAEVVLAVEIVKVIKENS